MSGRSEPQPRALLTGTTGGIGRPLARALLDAGYRITATGRGVERLERIAREDGWPEGRYRLADLDVADVSGWQEVLNGAITEWGGLDVLLNVAGYLKPGYSHELEPAEIDRHIDINVKGMLYSTHLAARHMVEQGHGHIINVASLAALTPVPGLPLYSASKHAVRAFSLAAAMELRGTGVAVTAVCPDAVDTPMLDLQTDYPEAALTFSGGRVLTAQDVVSAIMGPVLKKRPVEYALPRSRAILAKLGNAMPDLGSRIQPLLVRIGQSNQKKRT